MAEGSSSSSGIGVSGVLGIVFVVLKLVGVIDWSWWWVTCPFWIGFALLLVFVVLLGGGTIIGATFGAISARRTRRKMGL